MKRSSNPADGERGAMIGYRAQYLLAVDLIYSRLVDGTLEWIRIADPEAGRVDDIQISAAGRLDAYQIKWSEFVETVTFKQLISDQKEPDGKTKPNLMQQLADG